MAIRNRFWWVRDQSGVFFRLAPKKMNHILSGFENNKNTLNPRSFVATGENSWIQAKRRIPISSLGAIEGGFFAESR